MAKTNKNSDNTEVNKSALETKEGTQLSSLEETILRIRFGLGADDATDSMDRKVSDELRKKLQFLELKAFEQSGRINELLSDMEKKRQRR